MVFVFIHSEKSEVTYAPISGKINQIAQSVNWLRIEKLEILNASF